jgi:hypothetical protein
MSLIKAVVYPADVREPLSVLEIEASDLGVFQALVAGDIEALALYNPEMTLYLNEDGRRLRLPMNRRATVLANAHNEAFNAGNDSIVGDTFIVGPVDEDGNDTDAPERFISLASQ